ncbi:MAG: hypothetical protein AB8G77_04100 [Rhodothermales bacterium]
MRVLHATRVLNENLNLMRRAKEIDTRLAKGQMAIKQLQELVPYYQKGLVKLDPSPQELVARIYMAERNITNEHIESLFKVAAAQAKKASSSAARGQYLTELVEAVDKYKAQLGKSNEMRWRKRLEADRGKLLVENAGKDAGSGKRDMAIDQYIEALDMLRADDNGDPANKNRIEQIKKRINDLGGKVPDNWEKAMKSGGDGLPADNN